jgi:hypothetical protein
MIRPISLTDAWSKVFDTGSSDRAVQFVRLPRRGVDGVDQPFVTIRHFGPLAFEKARRNFGQS